MDSRVVSVGREEGLRFTLSWATDSGSGSAAEATRGRIHAQIGATTVWGLPADPRGSGVTWTWVELLEHLAENWNALLLEEVDPLGLNDLPSQLRSAAEQRWLDWSEALREREAEALWSFEQRHDLSAALHGAWPPHLWIVRRGRQYVIEGAGTTVVRPADEVEATLRDLGENIARRLDPVADDRARLAVNSWRSREDATDEQLLALAAGLDSDTWKSIRPSSPVPQRKEQLRQANEILAVARMLGPGCARETARRALLMIDQTPSRSTREVDRIAALLVGQGGSAPRPYEQGYALAQALRRALGTGPARPVDPDALLRSWGVELRDVDLGEPGLDAVAAWGPLHGPVILINRSSPRASKLGRRATLAHEIAHFLVDRTGALPLSEVLGGRVPRDVEARANAFAAEFLLPQDAARVQMLSERDPGLAASRLSRRFRVSREVAAWQILNSGVALSEDDKSKLRALVSQPQRVR